jgi:hypothetical protein
VEIDPWKCTQKVSAAGAHKVDRTLDKRGAGGVLAYRGRWASREWVLLGQGVP